MKKRVYKIKDKILVQGDENLLTEDEVLVKEENGSVLLKERVNGEVKDIVGGGSTSTNGSNESIGLKSINLDSLRIVEIQEVVNLSVFDSYFTFDVNLSKLNITASEYDALQFKNFTSNDEETNNMLSILSDLNIYVYLNTIKKTSIVDILKNNYLIGGFMQCKFPEDIVNLFGIEYYSEAILSTVSTSGASLDAPVSSVKVAFKFMF